MYINGSGRDYYEFYIQLNRCGTLGKNAISEKSRENPTVSLFKSSAIILKKIQNDIIIDLNLMMDFMVLEKCIFCFRNVSRISCGIR